MLLAELPNHRSQIRNIGFSPGPVTASRRMTKPALIVGDQGNTVLAKILAGLSESP